MLTELSAEAVEHGPVFYENVTFTYICIIIGIAVIYHKSFVEKRFSRWQAVLVAMSVIFPRILNIFFISGICPERFDPTPFGFGMTSIFILLAVYKYDFLDVNYMTFPKIFQDVPGGIIIVDRFGTVTFINETARKYLGEDSRIEHMYELIDDENFSMGRNDGFSEVEVTLDGRMLKILYTENNWRSVGVCKRKSG